MTDSKAKLAVFFGSKWFKRLFLFVSVATLLATTIFWAILGAMSQRLNSDQLIDAYMLQSQPVFAGAGFPGAHTFLFKWPLFAIMQFTGYSSAVFVCLTTVMVVVTVAIFAFILYKIEKRPYVFGTICLSLALALLLVPAQPYPGALLPVNMAMSTTRNLEYILYLLSLILVAKTTTIKSVSFWASIPILGLLIASDKLFAAMTIGGSILVTIVYFLLKRHGKMVKICLRWVLASGLGFALAAGILDGINHFGWTNIVNDASVSPFTLIKDATQFLSAIIYAVMGLLTNFGANPAHGTVIATDLPGALIGGYFSLPGAAYLVNLCVFLVALIIIVKLFLKSVKTNDSTTAKDLPYDALAIMLIFSVISSLASFVVTDHYYPVDARYLTISIFALFVGLAVYFRGKKLQVRYALPTIIILFAALPLAIIQCQNTALKEHQINQERDINNQKIVDSLKTHNSNFIIGNYWDTLPLKTYPGQENLTVVTLTNCYTPSTTLTSKTWQQDLANKPFAFLVTRDINADTFNGCLEGQIIDTYGQPNESITISGSSSNPQQMLLFYTQGTAVAKQKKHITPTITPAGLASFEANKCDKKTILTVVAHEDDDILFINPDIQNSIQAGECVRTIYVTAGDSGGTKDYWIGREQGAKAGYAKMAGKKNVWTQRDIDINGHDIIINTLRDNKSISLMFLRLPDGNVDGSGFGSQKNQSLDHLLRGSQSTIKSVDGQSEYTLQQIVLTFEGAMSSFSADEVRTHNTVAQTNGRDDHSDHVSVGDMVQNAFNAYKTKYPNSAIKHYSGYYVSSLPVNLPSDQIAKKEEIFMQYGQTDPSVCHTHAACFAKNEAYGKFLSREYQAGN